MKKYIGYLCGFLTVASIAYAVDPTGFRDVEIQNTLKVSAKKLKITNALSDYESGTNLGVVYDIDTIAGSESAVVFGTKDPTGTVDIVDAYFKTGANTVNNSKGTGTVYVNSGWVSAGNGASGATKLQSGSVTGTGTGNSGQVLVGSGDADAGATGLIKLLTGVAGAGNSGNITLQTGLASATRGKIKLVDGTEGTSGQAVKSTSTDGTIGFGVLGMAGGGTGLSAGTSGGVPYFSSSSTIASSGALTASQLVLGGGAGATPTSLAAGSQYQVLRMGAANPAYGSLNLDQAAAVTGTLPNSNTTATSANTNSAIVARDGSGNFSAGTITASLTGSVTGNADTATALAANPADCAANTYATTIAANGALTCATVTNAGLAGSIAASKLVGTDIATLGTITAGTWNGTKIGVAYGGTDLTTLTAHALYVGNGASAPTALSVGSTGTILKGTSASDPSFTANPVLGASGTTGTLGFSGTTSGTVTVQPQSTAGTYNFNLPITAGSNGQVLTSAAGGSSPMTWSTVATNPMTTAGDMIVSLDGSGTPGRVSMDSEGLLNCSLAAAVSANALQIGLKDAAGSDATASSPCIISFRNVTVATGTSSIVQVTAAVNNTISNGSSLGCTATANCILYVYAINNGGSVELATMGSAIIDDGSVASSTTEGGAGAADSAYTLYSNTGRSNKAVRLIGRIAITPAASFAWSNAVTEISLRPFRIYPRPPKITTLTSGTAATHTFATGQNGPIYAVVEMVGAGGSGAASGTSPGASANGGNTTVATPSPFSVTYTATGGNGGDAGGAGGTPTGCDINAQGMSAGGSRGGGGTTGVYGSNGGSTLFGSGGQGGNNAPGTGGGAQANSGGGGGGGGGTATVQAAIGGGAGGYCKVTIPIYQGVPATLTYTITASTTGATLGTGGAAGGNGAAGKIVITEYFQFIFILLLPGALRRREKMAA